MIHMIAMHTHKLVQLNHTFNVACLDEIDSSH
jgi:late competence protein required for DNA uptake (superfamily II DNA/RNA helicase)